MAVLRVLKRISREGCTVAPSLASASRSRAPASRPRSASRCICTRPKQSRRQLSPARCGRLLAPTNTSLGHTLTRCTVAPGTAGQALPSAVGVAGGWPQTNTPLRSCRPSALADQTGGGPPHNAGTPAKHCPQQLASPARSAAGHKQTRLCGHADPPPRRTRRGVVLRPKKECVVCLNLPAYWRPAAPARPRAQRNQRPRQRHGGAIGAPP